MHSAHAHKQAIAEYAASFLLEEASQQPQLLGIGTGSTVNCLIEALAPHHAQFLGALSSSEASTALLQAAGFKVFTPQEAQTQNILPHCHYYVDGADEINPAGEMIKGGGGALTREKIVANFAPQFICIADASKEVDVLGAFPLPIEVLPAALTLVESILQKRFPHSEIILRQKNDMVFVTDNQAFILDIHGLKIENPAALEEEIKKITGVVEVGIFAKQRAKKLITTILDKESNKESNKNFDLPSEDSNCTIQIIEKNYI